MSLMFAPIQKFGELQGRARRREYWLFMLFCVLLLGVLGGVASVAMESDSAPGRMLLQMAVLLWGLAVIALILPVVAVTVRRLHDAGFSGWWALLHLVPGASLALFVMTVLPGTAGANRFGADPRLAAPATADVVQ